MTPFSTPYDSKGASDVWFQEEGRPDPAVLTRARLQDHEAVPTTEIPWQEIETGLWIAECQCGKEYHREPPADGRVRLDPLDPSTFRHSGGCDQRDVTDPAIVRATLRVQDREGYWWVESSMCACCWQVAYYSAESN